LPKRDGERIDRWGARALAAVALAGLTDQSAVDELCEITFRFGSERLGAVLVDARCLPGDPRRGAAWLRLPGQPDHYAELDLDGADPPEMDALFELAVAWDDRQLQDVLTASGRLPSAPARRALWLLLSGQFDRYAELDVDGAFLRMAYQDADAGLRRRIAEQARAGGRVEWVRPPEADPPPGQPQRPQRVSGRRRPAGHAIPWWRRTGRSSLRRGGRCRSGMPRGIRTARSGPSTRPSAGGFPGPSASR
jgi:hypothetical protein